MKTSAVILFCIALISIVACSDSTEPVIEKPGTDLEAANDSIPHDFVVLTEPSPLQAGAEAEIIVEWSDANLNLTNVFVTLEGANSLRGSTLRMDPETRRYTWRQNLVMPAEFLSNFLFINVQDPDENVMHIHKAEVEGGFTEPDNTPPYDTLVNLYPKRITPGQTVQIVLWGHDAENNMAHGLTAEVADDPEAKFDFVNQIFHVNADAGVFSYRLDMTAPHAAGEYVLNLAVGDIAGEQYTFSEVFTVEPVNSPPFFREIWIEDKVADGYLGTVAFRVSGFDPDGDSLMLLGGVMNGSFEKDPPTYAADGTVTWTGNYIARTNLTNASIHFGLFDGNIEVTSDWYEIQIDQSGKPILDRYTITRNGVTGDYPLRTNTELSAIKGETVGFELIAHDPQGSPLSYEWYRYYDGATIVIGSESTLEYQMPDFISEIHISCTVRDPQGNLDNVSPTIFTVR